MRYLEAFRNAGTLFAQGDTHCPECACYGLHIELSPLYVDDKPGVHYLICQHCERIYRRPSWYETQEERIIRVLTEKIHELELRVSVLEQEKQERKQERKQEKPPDDEAITLPNLFTV